MSSLANNAPLTNTPPAANPASNPISSSLATPAIRHDWSEAEVQDLLQAPLFPLIDRARAIHLVYHPGGQVQLASLLSIKTGGCPENCGYCPQSAHYQKSVQAANPDLQKEPLWQVDEVLQRAQQAKDAGASRFCMGAAWRQVRDGEEFDRVLAMVRGVRDLGMEACVTLGMLNQDQANRLAQAGLTAYNHNLDTSAAFYDKIITTRRYEDRLQTLEHVRQAGITVCCGGIVGLGEGVQDRAAMLQTLANLTPHPESVPINALVAVAGTPLADQPPVEPLEFVRMVAVARILMPATMVRLSAGRQELGEMAQLLALYAGANSIFYGDKLLTTGNPDVADDQALLAAAGLTPSLASSTPASCASAA
ncbi:MAG: biotin synthase BioB [Rhodospirillaceae bacterium]|nr:biotin synthase BioB [Rhodospirillaceae bacterium]